MGLTNSFLILLVSFYQYIEYGQTAHHSINTLATTLNSTTVHSASVKEELLSKQSSARSTSQIISPSLAVESIIESTTSSSPPDPPIRKLSVSTPTLKHDVKNTLSLSSMKKHMVKNAPSLSPSLKDIVKNTPSLPPSLKEHVIQSTPSLPSEALSTLSPPAKNYVVDVKTTKIPHTGSGEVENSVHINDEKQLKRYSIKASISKDISPSLVSSIQLRELEDEQLRYQTSSESSSNPHKLYHLQTVSMVTDDNDYNVYLRTSRLDMTSHVLGGSSVLLPPVVIRNTEQIALSTQGINTVDVDGKEPSLTTLMDSNVKTFVAGAFMLSTKVTSSTPTQTSSSILPRVSTRDILVSTSISSSILQRSYTSLPRAVSSFSESGSSLLAELSTHQTSRISVEDDILSTGRPAETTITTSSISLKKSIPITPSQYYMKGSSSSTYNTIPDISSSTEPVVSSSIVPIGFPEDRNSTHNAVSQISSSTGSVVSSSIVPIEFPEDRKEVSITPSYRLVTSKLTTTSTFSSTPSISSSSSGHTHEEILATKMTQFEVEESSTDDYNPKSISLKNEETKTILKTTSTMTARNINSLGKPFATTTSTTTVKATLATTTMATTMTRESSKHIQYNTKVSSTPLLRKVKIRQSVSPPDIPSQYSKKEKLKVEVKESKSSTIKHSISKPVKGNPIVNLAPSIRRSFPDSVGLKSRSNYNVLLKINKVDKVSLPSTSSTVINMKPQEGTISTNEAEEKDNIPLVVGLVTAAAIALIVLLIFLVARSKKSKRESLSSAKSEEKQYDVEDVPLRDEVFVQEDSHLQESQPLHNGQCNGNDSNSKTVPSQSKNDSIVEVENNEQEKLLVE